MFNIPFFAKKLGQGQDSISTERETIRLVIGLGNPGDKYGNTYHNAGFLFVNSLIENAESGERLVWKDIKSFRYINLRPLILAKPDTFMNNSGEAVKDILRYFRVKPEEMLVVHDDSDIKLGGYKLSSSGSSAGHKGIESIISALGTKNFHRARIGIRKSGGKAEGFVLKKITQDDRLVLRKVFEKVAGSINSHGT